jgi:hypothetical protein
MNSGTAAITPASPGQGDVNMTASTSLGGRNFDCMDAGGVGPAALLLLPLLLAMLLTICPLLPRPLWRGFGV